MEWTYDTNEWQGTGEEYSARITVNDEGMAILTLSVVIPATRWDTEYERELSERSFFEVGHAQEWADAQDQIASLVAAMADIEMEDSAAGEMRDIEGSTGRHLTLVTE